MLSLKRLQYSRQTMATAWALLIPCSPNKNLVQLFNMYLYDLLPTWAEFRRKITLSRTRTKELENQATIYTWWLPSQTEVEETWFGVQRASFGGVPGSGPPSSGGSAGEGQQLRSLGCTAQWGGALVLSPPAVQRTGDASPRVSRTRVQLEVVSAPQLWCVQPVGIDQLSLYETTVDVSTHFQPGSQLFFTHNFLWLVQLHCRILSFLRQTSLIVSIYSLQKIINFHCVCVFWNSLLCFSPWGNTSWGSFKFYGIVPKSLRFGEIV